jgi:hypothetical protein
VGGGVRVGGGGAADGVHALNNTKSAAVIDKACDVVVLAFSIVSSP